MENKDVKKGGICSREMWRELKTGDTFNQTIASVKSNTGEIITNPENIMNEISRHLRGLGGVEEPSCVDYTDSGELESCTEFDKPITLKECMTAVKELGGWKGGRR